MAFVTVSGTVGRTFFDGKGAEVVESWEARGETFTKKWAAFFDDPHGLVEGDVVEVSGVHQDKVDVWEKDGETRHTVKRSIGKARVKGSGNAAVPQATEPADSWNDGGTPF